MRSGSRRGASLAEVTVAIVVLGSGVLALAGLVGIAASVQGEAREIDALVRVTGEVAGSLRLDLPLEEGERREAGSVVRWRPLREGGMARIELRAWSPERRGDTLEAILLVADTVPVPRGGGDPPSGEGGP